MASLPEGSTRHPAAYSYSRIHETSEQFALRQPGIFVTHKRFSLTRHPARRFRSLYQFLKQRQPLIPELIPIQNIDQFVSYIERDVSLTITDPYASRRESLSHLARSLSGVLGIGTIFEVDRWYKLELLSEQWEGLLEWLMLPYRPLQHVNESIPIQVEGKKWKDFVREYYRSDFENFEYSRTF